MLTQFDLFIFHLESLSQDIWGQMNDNNEIQFLSDNINSIHTSIFRATVKIQWYNSIQYALFQKIIYLIDHRSDITVGWMMAPYIPTLLSSEPVNKLLTWQEGFYKSKVWDRFDDGRLPDLNLEEGIMSQEMWAASRSWKWWKKEIRILHDASRRTAALSIPWC